ncbi:MAG: S8 family serine peptidase [Anaerolineae bacterium]|nr:S8 family serine peptidase [Anaerolineae bacterium]
MLKRGFSSSRTILLIAIISLFWIMQTARNATVSAHAAVTIPADLLKQAQTQGTASVMVTLNTSFLPEGALSSSAITTQRTTIAAAQSQLLTTLATQITRVRHQYRYIPALSLEVTAAGLQQLSTSPLIASINAIPNLSLDLSESTQIIGATTAWGMGFDGTGQVVAIIDDGIMEEHPFLSTKIIFGAEACFTQSTEDPCPNGTSSQFGSGAAAHRGLFQLHGSHVAGIAAGRQASGTPLSGVARGATIIPINVFFSPDGFGITESATGDDIIAGLEYVYSIRGSYNIVAVNMSLGIPQDYHTTTCDTFDPSTKLAIDNLRSVNIATIIAAGNDAAPSGTFINGISFPACISSAVSVGATDKQDNIASFSQSASFLSLLAPGVAINSSVPFLGIPDFMELDGTSMAAPHVTGAWAILRQKSPSSTVAEILQALQTTGPALTDARNGVTARRIRVDLALAQLPGGSGTPIPTSTVAPSATPTKTATPTATVTGSPTPTRTSSPTPSATASVTPTRTGSPSPTPTKTNTPLPISTSTATATATSTSATPHPDTIGIFRSSVATFYMRNSNTTGFADSSLTFGSPTDFPITGDWNGDGIDTAGVYRQSTGQFFLTDSTTNPAVLHYSFVLGSPGDQPIVGDWDGDGKDGVGVFRPSNGLIYLKNALTTGFADFTMVLGSPGDVGLAGDWNGDGKDSPGVYRPSNQQFYVTNSICNCSVFADAQIGLGIAGDTPFVGDWDGDGTSGIGVYRQSNGLTYIKNALTTGFADASFVFGSASDYPLAGYWVRVGSPSGEPAPTFQPKP